LDDDEVMVDAIPSIVYETESTFARVTRVALLQKQLAKQIKQDSIDIVISGE
jgi:hypothetical protein